MDKKYDWLPSEKDIENYNLLVGMLQAQKHEFDLLAKKKADGPLNKMKIKIVNRVLEPLSELLKNEPSHKFLDILNEEDLPTNSDVVLIISQYEQALENFKSKYFVLDEDNTDDYGDAHRRWNIAENPIKFDSTKDEEYEDDEDNEDEE